MQKLSFPNTWVRIIFFRELQYNGAVAVMTVFLLTVHLKLLFIIITTEKAYYSITWAEKLKKP